MPICRYRFTYLGRSHLTSKVKYSSCATNNQTLLLFLYKGNRAFSGIEEVRGINQHRQIFNFTFKMNKLKTKYKNKA